MSRPALSSSVSRIVHFANEKKYAPPEFVNDGDWNVYRGGSLPIVLDDDACDDDALEFSLKFDPVLYAASEWTSNGE